jgi:hypothetical protein
MVKGLELRIQEIGFKIYGLGFRVKYTGDMVQD